MSACLWECMGLGTWEVRGRYQFPWSWGYRQFELPTTELSAFQEWPALLIGWAISPVHQSTLRGYSFSFAAPLISELQILKTGISWLSNRLYI